MTATAETTKTYQVTYHERRAYGTDSVTPGFKRNFEAFDFFEAQNKARRASSHKILSIVLQEV